MNKKQLIVAWVVGIAISITFLFYPKRYFVGYENSQFFLAEPRRNTLPVTQYAYVIPICISILIVGSLLIYTLKDKKK